VEDFLSGVPSNLSPKQREKVERMRRALKGGRYSPKDVVERRDVPDGLVKTVIHQDPDPSQL